ncbi:P-loop containing nucleoside triphosphate hydrolase protein [Suillus subluteus]|nr:P-loop containing nucleoside triphosphate hydrolase protein [Suillus subluteus]
MSGSHISTPGEKRPASQDTQVSQIKSKRDFFSRNKDESIAVEKKDPDDDDVVVDAKLAQSIQPVSFFSLFRFSTSFEVTIDVIGVVCAVAAGAAQPLMSLLFGNLTQDFVNFSLAENNYTASLTSGDPTAIAQAQQILDAAAAGFRQSSASDASYLTYIGVGMFVCTYVYMTVWTYTGEVNAKRVRERYLQAVLRQEIAYFDDVGAGEVATRIQTDTHLVQQGISEKVPIVVSFLAAFVTGFVLAYIRSWRLALALTSIFPCIAITGAVMNKFVSKYMQMSLNHVAEGGTLAEEVIATVRTAQAFGAQKFLSSLYDRHIDGSRIANSRGAIWQGGGLAAFFFVIYCAYALAFDFGTTLINEGLANAGQVVNVFLAILIGSFSLALLAPEMQAINHGRGAAAKLYATIERTPAIDSADPGGLKPEKVIGEITLENTAALVGASGSGKSTIVSLMERFYDPSSGSVKLDGVDLPELNIKWLRSQIGLVSQEPTLFATTIKGNVLHGLIGTPYENASEEEKFKLIQEACIKSNADGFITKLPQGYDTLVGERGFLLSGGQKQRIAIARAIVSDPRILLLDEATSALDTRSEGIVQDALDKAAAGRTTITVAHRLSTIKDADRIFVMGDGLVLEQGTHDELLADENGAYARLVQAQKLRESREGQNDESTKIAGSEEDMEKAVEEEIPLDRKHTNHSVTSDIVNKRSEEKAKTEINEDEYSLFYLFKRMGGLNREGLYRYVIGTFFAMCTGAVYPAFGIVYGQAISGFSAPTNAERRYDGDRNALWFFIIAILSAMSIGFQNFYFASSAAILTAKLRSICFKAILRQDVEYFDKEENSTGALTSNLSENPQKINGLAGVTLGTIVQAFVTVITGSVIGLCYAWQPALVGMGAMSLQHHRTSTYFPNAACIPVLISAGYIRLRVVVLKDQQNKAAHESSAQLACEAASAIRTVASLTREEDFLQLYSTSLEGPLRRSNHTALWSSFFFALSQAMSFFVISLIFWYGSILVSHFEITVTGFFVALMSTTFGAIQAGNVFAFVPDISSAKGAGAAIIKLIDSTPEIDAESTEGKIISGETVRGQIRFENIHFRYPTRPGIRVLRGLSFKIEPGTYVALVGASGCGKSTVIQLIERFYDPLSGQVLLDDEPINEFNVQEYRKQIALVSQEPTLYAGTIRFNILLGAIKPESEVTQEEIEAVCRNANVLDFIKSLPNGFDTEVGGKGSQLSGGQKQRIAIARALLRNPKVLLLDEATSALDSNSEKVVQAALDQAAKGRTTIAIAHRLSTIQNADCIYFIKEGRVSEAGTHDELLSLKGDYYEYVQLQALSKK